MNRTFIILVMLALAACAKAPSAPHDKLLDDPKFELTGTWEGILDGYGGPNFVDGSGQSKTFRIVFDDKRKARVFIQHDSAWTEMKSQGSFRVRKLGPQAVVSSISSGGDNDGTWVENTSFTLVRHDLDSVVVYWLRTVNNVDLPITNANYHFAWGMSGKMNRVANGSPNS